MATCKGCNKPIDYRDVFLCACCNETFHAYPCFGIHKNYGYPDRVAELEAEGLCTSDAQAVADAEELRLWADVRGRMRLAPSFQALRKAAMRFTMNLHKLDSAYCAEREREYITEPEKLLSAHAGVMDAKSARCKTLRALADAVIAEAGLPMQPRGLYRGMDYLVDVWKLHKPAHVPAEHSAT